MFEKVGETLRRLRRERHLTLEKLGERAHLGRGQLSRIENGFQEATLTTLAKILDAQGVSRRDFFRRYDLVENEAKAVARDAPAAADTYPVPHGGADLPGEISDVLGTIETFIQTTLQRSRPVAQGAVEVGDFTVLFRVVPRAVAAGEITGHEPVEPTPPPPAAVRKHPRRKRR